MQHTLIPFKDRTRLHREYAVRASTVSLFALSVSIVVGLASLFPAYVKSLYSDRSAGSAISAANDSKTDTELQNTKNSLVSDGKLLATVSGSAAELRFSDIVRSIIGVRGSVVITSLSMSIAGPNTVSVSIKGTAPTRDALLAFRTRLEALLPGTKIDIPIDQLSKNADLSYSLKFTKKSP